MNVTVVRLQFNSPQSTVIFKSRPTFTYDERLQVRACHCLISNREGLGTSLQIMGLATIDPHSQKEHTEIHKIPKFGVYLASFH